LSSPRGQVLAAGFFRGGPLQGAPNGAAGAVRGPAGAPRDAL